MRFAPAAPWLREVVDPLLLPLPEVKAGQMFGMPCYFVRGKSFVGMYGETLLLKLPAAEVERLLGSGTATPFRHLYSGRTMREWVQLEGRTRQILALEEPLLKTAWAYVRDQAGPR